MIKEFHIKAVDIHCIRAFKKAAGGGRRGEEIRRRNDIIKSYLFKATAAGKIKGFYKVDDKNFRVCHRSTKNPDSLQWSSGFYQNGELIPCYDCQYKYSELDEFLHGYRAEMGPGTYRIIE